MKKDIQDTAHWAKYHPRSGVWRGIWATLKREGRDYLREFFA
jgi:hypothetical protein